MLVLQVRSDTKRTYIYSSLSEFLYEYILSEPKLAYWNTISYIYIYIYTVTSLKMCISFGMVIFLLKFYKKCHGMNLPCIFFLFFFYIDIPFFPIFNSYSGTLLPVLAPTRHVHHPPLSVHGGRRHLLLRELDALKHRS